MFIHLDSYHSVSSELLTSVKKMEDSLKRLKAQRKSFAGMQSSPTGMSDDDKIRLQLSLDIRFYGEKVSLNAMWGYMVRGAAEGMYKGCVIN